MKIGITTYFNIKNYGSALQAFAMRAYLKKAGHSAEFLNIREGKPADKLLHKIHVASVTLLKCLFCEEAYKTQREIAHLKKETSSVITDKSKAAFDCFEKKFLPSRTIGRRQLKKAAATDEYSAFICGSDQIWSPLSPHLSGFKFLSFAPESKRIAYAPSFGVSKIPSYNRAFVKKSLLGINDISVREYDGAKIVKELTGRDVPVLLDPTMLLSAKQWREVYKESGDAVDTNEKYILCYFFEEPGAELISKITEFASDKNLKIKVMFSSNREFIKNGAECVDAGPLEFLQLTDNAEYIFTNSFHGCVFSVLFGKKFIAFGRNHSEAVKQTSRIETLLKKVSAEKSFYSTEKTEFVFSDTSKFEEKVDEMRRDSEEFLLNCLEKRAK